MELFEFEEPDDPELQDWQVLRVHFSSPEDRQALGALLNQQILSGTYNIWFPDVSPEVAASLPGFTGGGGGFKRSQLASQEDLFDVETNWKDLWHGMPEYESNDVRPYLSLEVHFQDMQARNTFAKLLGYDLSEKAPSIWYPKRERYFTTEVYRSTDAARNMPRYPIYVPTKGRWESALTIRALERMGVPYYAVVQPQEAENYRRKVITGQLLTLPPDCCVPGLGVVPARNWIRRHSIALGAKRHWQFDDNINGFYRLHDNRKITVEDGTIFRIMEDFSDRYSNVGVSGPHYDFFAPRRTKLPPFVLNTRVYSCSLINNEMGHEWRDVYNEDTDICLRTLKDGLCTVQFYTFLQKKAQTMAMKGGNTDILYKGGEGLARDRDSAANEGRRLMAESLMRQHPDCVTVIERWGRPQHLVDYRRFRKNELIPAPGFVMPEGADEYGMILVPKLMRPPAQGSKPKPVVPTGPPASIWDFLGARTDHPSPSAAPMGITLETPKETLGPSVLVSPEPSSPLPVAPPWDDEVASVLKATLEQRGHRVITKEGRLFVKQNQESPLTPEEILSIRESRDALLAIADSDDAVARFRSSAESMQDEAEMRVHLRSLPTAPADTIARHIHPSPVVTTLFAEAKPQSLAQFLHTLPPQGDGIGWKADEPPQLDGVKDVVLNFATNGVNWLRGDKPVGVTVSTLDGKLTRFLPFAFKGGGNLDEETIKRWAREQLRGKKITNANTRFDVHQARVWGIDLEEQGCTFSDIQHTAALLDDHRKRFRLDLLAEDYLPGQPITARVDETRHAEYHAADVAEREHFTAQLVGRLTAVMQPMIDEQNLRTVHNLEDSVIPALVEMEKNGSPIDLALLEEFSASCLQQHYEIMREISTEVGFAFEHKPSGWTQLLEHYNLPVPEGFAEANLNQIKHPMVQKAQYAAQLASLNSKIFKAYKEKILDGVLYYDINQLRGDDGGTVSGRFSIGYVQQVPNADNHSAVFGDALFPRRLFVPSSGQYLEADAAQIEYRLFAHYANNKEIIEAYAADPLLSFHKMTWGKMQKYKPDMKYSHQKSFNFAKQYGARSLKLAVMMGFITDAEANEIRQDKRWNDPRLTVIHEIEAAYKRMMPEGDVLLERAAHLAKPECDDSCKRGDAMHRQYKHRGYVQTLLGRRSRFPSNYKTYIGLNRVLQGTAADIMKQKLVELHRERKNTGLVMRMTVHDAVGGDATTPETLGKVTEILNHQSFPLKVPILWACQTGANWAECK